MTTTFTIHKVECQSCVVMIESVSEDIPGVERAEVRARQRQLVLTHDPSVDVHNVEKILAAAGYPVSIAAATAQ